MEKTDQYGRQIFELPKQSTAVDRPSHFKSQKPVERKLLKPTGAERDFNPESVLGKSVTVTKESLAKDISAFYCDLCKCALKDSTAWYDHINGKKHNRMKGMSMIVEKVEVSRVKQRLQALKEQKLGKRLQSQAQHQLEHQLKRAKFEDSESDQPYIQIKQPKVGQKQIDELEGSNSKLPQKTALAEICVFSPEAAIMALDAGAPRIELCDAPEKDGVSPTESQFQSIPAQYHAQLAVMVRPRGGNFCMSASEVKIMEKEIIRLRTKKVGALVFGLLTPDNEIDVPACQQLLKTAGQTPCVFHRAFDLVPNSARSLKILIELGFKRLLCGRPLPELINLKNIAQDHITIMPGGGVRSHNVQSYLDAGFTEIHSSARTGGLLPDQSELKKIILACQNHHLVNLPDSQISSVTSLKQVQDKSEESADESDEDSEDTALLK